MVPLSEKYEGSMCEIKTERNDLLLTGIIGVIDDDGIDIISADKEHLPLIPYQKAVKISVFNTKLGFRILMGVAYLSTDRFLRVVEVETLKEFERRTFFRVNLKISAMLQRLEGNKQDKSLPEDRVGEPLEVSVENVSLSGLLFSAEVPFMMGDLFEMEFTIFKTPLVMKCRICRIEEVDETNERYGCQFVDYTQRQTDILCRDLFQLQRLEINKRRTGIV